MSTTSITPDDSQIQQGVPASFTYATTVDRQRLQHVDDSEAMTIIFDPQEAAWAVGPSSMSARSLVSDPLHVYR
ncbi:hypothetical protein HGRIS_010387 [Hohenbuehelia grisea]|uniref:Uncharacterized protein n=1 Tax=Hohenbuehelia grisea TaxID=104357 RepID=A0ABR3J486_9AGAR